MTLNFEPHSWYKAFAIQLDPLSSPESSWKWTGYYEDGELTYSVLELHADTLKDLKQQITDFHADRAERDRWNREARA